MPNVVSAVVTNGFRAALPQILSGSYGGRYPASTIAYPLTFAFGEGSWVSTPSGLQPVPPDPTLTNLTAGTGIYTSTAYKVGGTFVPTDVTFVGPYRLSIRCFLPVGTGNDDGFGNPPQFFELGVFDGTLSGMLPTGTMILYSTFPVEVKTSSKSLEHFIYVDF